MAHLQLAILYLAPAVAVALLLWSGRYPGERTLARLRDRLHRPMAHAERAICAPLARRARMRRLAGGLLLAERIAPRGPPVAGCPN